MRLALALALAALPATALAQGLPEPTKAQCYMVGDPQGANQTVTYLDMGMTQQFRIDAANMDAGVMADFTGVWYGEFQTQTAFGPTSTQINYSFEPNGLFQYQSRSCWSMGCNDGYGTGQWVGLKQPGGKIRVIYNWSDLERTSACSGNTGVLDGDIFRADLGGVWQRTQKY